MVWTGCTVCTAGKADWGRLEHDDDDGETSGVMGEAGAVWSCHSCFTGSVLACGSEPTHVLVDRMAGTVPDRSATAEKGTRRKVFLETFGRKALGPLVVSNFPGVSCLDSIGRKEADGTAEGAIVRALLAAAPSDRDLSTPWLGSTRALRTNADVDPT